MYSHGRLYAEQQGLDITRYNSYLRAMTSLGWMIAPAISFLIADLIDAWAVFKTALLFWLLWVLFWLFTMSKANKEATKKSDENKIFKADEVRQFPNLDSSLYLFDVCDGPFNVDNSFATILHPRSRITNLCTGNFSVRQNLPWR